MEEVRRINKKGHLVCTIQFNGHTYKRYPNGKHQNYYYQSDGARGHDKKMLHHAIWEFYYKKIIPKNMCIHHIDHNPLNNDISNLMLVTRSEHQRLHPEKLEKILAERKNIIGAYSKENWQERREKAISRLQSHPKICEWCGKEFVATNVHQRFCSEKCHHRWQYKSPTNDVEMVCQYCGETFMGNKYLKPKCCSDEHAHRLLWANRRKNKG